MLRSIKRMIKFGVLLLLWAVYGFVFNIYYPILTTAQALEQLKDSNAAYANYMMYQQIWNYAGIGLGIITVLVIISEIKNRKIGGN